MKIFGYTLREMRKEIKAYALGYRLYKVNDVSFTRYTQANRRCDELIADKAPNIEFYGRHKKRGWEGFYVSASNIKQNHDPAFTANARY